MPLYAKLVIGFLVFLALLFFRIELLLRGEAGETLPAYVGRVVIVVGTVADDPDIRANSVRTVLRVETVGGTEASGKLLAVVPPGTALAYGDRVEVRGFVELPVAFETNTGRMFDYPGYLRVRGISAVMEHSELRLWGPGGYSLRSALFSLKHFFERALEQVLPEPQVSLLKGILLGERGGLSSELMAAFVAVGLIHIVVLSGSNISLVSEGIFRALGFLPRRFVYLAGAAAIMLFVLMTGSGAASVRALVMGGIALLARYLNRPVLAMRALVVAAGALVLYNPLYATDSGFVLSMLATFGLITIAPVIETNITLVPAWRHFNLHSIVASTLAVEIFLLPALLYFSGVLSLVALPVNVLVLPWVWLVMFFGFMTGLLSGLHPALALVPAFVTDMLLRAVLLVAQWGSAIPYAATTVAPFPWWVVFLIYAPLTAVALRIYARIPTSLCS